MKDANTNNLKSTLINFIVPLVSLVISLVLVIAVIIPLYSKIPELQAELDSKKTLHSLLITKLGVLKSLQDFKEVVDENARLFTLALVDEPMVPELLTQVDTIARNSGLAVTKLSYSISDIGGADPEVLSYKAVIINLGVSGSYDQVTAFLQNLENASRLVDVTNYRFSAVDKENPSVYDATFILRSPYLLVASTAVTDAPVNIDINGGDFQNILGKIRSLRHYDVQAAQEFVNLEEEEVPVEETQETTVSE